LQTEAARCQGRTPISSNLAAAWRKWAVIQKTVHPTELRHVAQIAALCEIRLLDLFALTTPRIDQLAATAVHHARQRLQVLVVRIRSQPVEFGGIKHAVDVEMLILGRDRCPAARA